MKINIIITSLLLLFTFTSNAHPIDDYYSQHKDDNGMESKKIPPKMAAMMVDDEYTEAIDILKSLRSLKYLNYYGDETKIQNYGKTASSKKGNFSQLLDTVEGTRNIKVFGIKKKNKIKKVMVVVVSKVQFLLIIAKGKLVDSQIDYLPQLSKEIQ